MHDLYHILSATCSYLIGYAQNGRGEEALRLLVDMIQNRLRPDQYTLVSILAACSSLASLTEGKQTHALVFKYMLDTNVSVGNALITMYSKCGCLLDFESAFEQISSPNIVSWNTIIAALAQHGLYEKALCFFTKMELHGTEPDGITLLSLLSACGHAGTHFNLYMITAFYVFSWEEYRISSYPLN